MLLISCETEELNNNKSKQVFTKCLLVLENKMMNKRERVLSHMKHMSSI